MYFLIVLFLATAVRAQHVGTYTPEVHPSLKWQSCDGYNVCITQNGSLTLDANWRWVHDVNDNNCYEINTWNFTLCPDDPTCANNCMVDGAEYSTFGIVPQDENALRLELSAPNVGSRVFMMADETHYQLFDLLNKEFSFEVDTSTLGCGYNGALYFVSMDADGGVARFPANKAGAKYGTGYCDAQCSQYNKFIDGTANCDGWTQFEGTNQYDYADAGLGYHGSCCAEMDVWVANGMSTTFRAMPCATSSQVLCLGDACLGNHELIPQCDINGCDFNPYRMGNTTFYGPGMTLDTNSPFTVVTQFVTDNGTSTGNLAEIKRFYIQSGITIPSPVSAIPNVSGDSLTTSFCNAQKTAFNDADTFASHGGMASMTEALQGGMVLVMMAWHDKYSEMIWLDGEYPFNASATQSDTLGVMRGRCPRYPSELEAVGASPYVTFSNIRVGEIGSTV